MADKLADVGEHLGSHAAAIGDEASAAVRDAAEDAGDVASGYLGQAADAAKHGYQYATEKLGAAKETTEGYIQNNPWVAVGVAFGIGIVAGMLLLRSTRD
jgi:ElaB/YqjD/DUF883 family membrane-anchored ribosome-binding protein